jgi:hypothetical protein
LKFSIKLQSMLGANAAGPPCFPSPQPANTQLGEISAQQTLGENGMHLSVTRRIFRGVELLTCLSKWPSLFALAKHERYRVPPVRRRSPASADEGKCGSLETAHAGILRYQELFWGKAVPWRPHMQGSCGTRSCFFGRKRVVSESVIYLFLLSDLGPGSHE